MIHHRTPEFESTLRSVSAKLKQAFDTTQPVFMQASTGSGGMESAIVNTLSPGDEILCVVSGKFGERWADIAKAYGIKTHILEVPWGEAVDPQKVAAFLDANTQIKAVLTQACETSTATVHPIRQLAEIVKTRSQTLLLVDAITAACAMPLEMDKWGLDVVVGGSQKAFQLPTGLSFIALSQKAWQFNKNAKCPKYYWDLQPEQKALAKGETHFSSVVPLVRALDVALDFFIGEEKLKTLRRIERLAKTTREIGECYGLKVYSKSPSPSVTALLTPAGVDSQKLRDHIEREYNMTLMGGQEQLKGKILRIGHIGYITNEDMLAFAEILYLALRDFKVDSIDKTHLERAKKIVTTNLTQKD